MVVNSLLNGAMVVASVSDPYQLHEWKMAETLRIAVAE